MLMLVPEYHFKLKIIMLHLENVKIHFFYDMPIAHDANLQRFWFPQTAFQRE